MIQKQNLVLTLTLLIFTLTLVGVPVLSQPTVAAAPGAWWGDYFANRDLGGSPVMSRYDDAVNFSWGTGSPGGGVPSDDFSVRWTREDWFAGGTYRFTVLSDDGVRIWVGDQLVVDEWRDRWAEPLYVDHYIPTGTYQVRIEYFEHHADATISVGWRPVSGGSTWRGEYFDNQTFAGTPAVVRYDEAIDFDWGSGSPDPSMGGDTFSVRWTRTLGFNPGTYRFLTSTDDGVRVWVDGGLVVDAWEEMKLPNTHTGEVYLAAGQHTIVVEYYERGGGASAHVWWQLREAFTDWQGEYFDNRNMVGGPALERNDGEISFDWGVGPPVDWMPDDNFSVRWTRTVHFTPGYYRFALQADDGVRLWLDQAIIIDKWQDMDYELHYVDGTYLQGPHTIRLEYYERNGHARVRFWWESSTDGNAPPTYIPEPIDDSIPEGTGWEAAWADDPWETSYFDNTELRGEPVLSRIEESLDHNWGFSSPGSGVPTDYFSARWIQPLYFEGGLYRFTTYTDDGVRLWVDRRLLIDSWRPMRGYRNATVRLSPGIHDIKMEYYERTGVALAQLTWRRVSR
ncbi:MAG: hypothetical protein GY832_24870 [Chloroflexi bacterium]|nr:hypothetical protein [Chloroflexota bacterium]